MRLFPHQEIGIEFLGLQPHAMLADEMGLGKTLQALIAARPPVVVVCPAIAIGSWVRDLNTLGHRYKVFYKSKDFNGEFAEYNVMSYGIFRTNHGKIKDTQTLIVDESHYIKDPESQSCKAITKFWSTPQIILLTGTPVKNSYADFYSQARLIVPNHVLRKHGVSTFATWKQKFCKLESREIYVAGGRKRFITSIVGNQNAPLLKSIIDPYFLRRTKKQVLKDLPALQWAAYSVEGPPPPFYSAEELADADALKQTEGIMARRAGHALKKVPYAVEIIEDYVDNQNRPMVVFCNYLDAIHSLAQSLTKYRVAIIDGSVSPAWRSAIVDRFQKGEYDVLIGQAQAAGVGITLTKANYCLFIDLCWTPADNLQLRDRLHRIGQTMEVIAHYLVFTNDPLDARVSERLAQKTLALQELELA